MSSNQAPVVSRIRIIPRSQEFLNRNVGNSGEMFYSRDGNTLRLYDGSLAGGHTVACDTNLSLISGDTGVASLGYDVTIDNQGAGNKYVFNNVIAPELQLVIGYTYVFDQSDQTNEYYPNPNGGVNNQHPLAFSSDAANGELDFGTAYLTNVKYELDGKVVDKETYQGVKFASATTRKVYILITKDTPTTLYYYCTRHIGMGSTITVVEPGAGGGGNTDANASIAVGENAPDSPVVGNIWFNNSTGVLYIRADDESGDEYWVQPSVPQTNAFTQFTVDTTTLAPIDSADEITFVAGSNVTITADDVANTITIASTGGGGGGGADLGELTITDSTISSSGSTVEIDDALNVTGNITAPGFVNGGVGGATIDSASTLTIDAPDGVTMNAADGVTINAASGLTVNASSGITFNSDSVDLGTILRSSELINTKTGATGVVTHDYSTGAVWYHSGMAADFTVDLTNVPTTDNRVNVITLIMSQGATPYLPTAFRINGIVQSILWLDATIPTGTGGQLDVVTFSLIRQSSSWSLIGALTTFG